MGAGRPWHNYIWRGARLGECCNTDIQVAINEGNRRQDAFFVIRVGKAGTSLPFQQSIPTDFARYHGAKLPETITLESPSGRSWSVVVRPLSHVIRFGKGWRSFSLENHLREGYQLLFALVRKSHFVVKFFDQLGKCQISFPPLPAPLPAAQSHAPPVKDEVELASEPHTLAAKPLQFLPNGSKPAATPPARPAALNSDQAKIILRHYLPQPPPEVPNPKPTVLREDHVRAPEENAFLARTGFSTLGDTETEHHMTEPIQEGMDLDMDLDTDDDLDIDDDDALIYIRTAAKYAMPKPATSSMRNSDQVIKDLNEIYSGEQTGFHSPEHHEIHTDSEEDNNHIYMSKTNYSDDASPLKYLERQKRPVMRKKLAVKRPAWEGEGDKVRLSSSTSAPESATWGYREVGDSSRGSSGRRRGVEGGSGETLSGSSRAMRLLQQQGCLRFSEIVSKCKRPRVSEKERYQVVNAARRFASSLENEKFLVVMRDAQVYYGFRLVIPPEILVVTGTLRADKVKVCLTDSKNALYVANWEWQGFYETPLLKTDRWAQFALDHALEEGDVCVFELVDSDPDFISGFLISVHIFRVVDHIVELPVNDSFESRGGQTALHKTLGMRSSELDRKHDRGTKRPINECACYFQPRTKSIKPQLKFRRHFGGSRGQREF